MKTLYININGEKIQNTEYIIVLGRPEDAIINKFYFELGKEILRGVVVPGVTSIKKKDIVIDFKAHDEKSFNNILEQWDTLKQELLGENPSGSRTIKLPDEYISWLQNRIQPVYAEIAKSLYKRGGSVEVSLVKIYKNAIDIIVNNIDPEECKDCGMFVVNDDAVTDNSAITRSIQERIPQIAFVPFEDFGKCPKCGKKPCECKPEPPVCPKCGEKPCICDPLENSVVIGIRKEESYIKDIAVYVKGQEVYRKTGYNFVYWADSSNEQIHIEDRYCFTDNSDIIRIDGTVEKKQTQESTEYVFDWDGWFKQHPEYEDENDSNDYAGEVCGLYNIKRKEVDLWIPEKNKFLFTLPPKTRFDDILPSGFYVVKQYIDANNLAFGVMNSNGVFLIPCKYLIHNRHELEFNPFSEIRPGIIEYKYYFLDHTWRYRNIFNNDIYNEITKDFCTKVSTNPDGEKTLHIIDNISFQEIRKVHGCGGIGSRLVEGWYLCSMEDGGLILLNKYVSFILSNREIVYGLQAARAFIDADIINTPFISENRIITLVAHSGKGIETFETIRIYNYNGKLIREHDMSHNPILIKQPYKYGKAICFKIGAGYIQLCYLDKEGNIHDIPSTDGVIKNGYICDNYWDADAFMVSEDAFVLNICPNWNNDEGKFLSELRTIYGDKLYDVPTWIMPFSDNYLAYWEHGKYGVIDRKGEKIIPPLFEEYELIKFVNGENKRYNLYGEIKER